MTRLPDDERNPGWSSYDRHFPIYLALIWGGVVFAILVLVGFGLFKLFGG
jgi:hypothetical protein